MTTTIKRKTYEESGDYPKSNSEKIPIKPRFIITTVSRVLALPTIVLVSMERKK